MDILLARQSCATSIALASPRFLNPSCLAPPTRRCAASSYLASRKASWRVASRHTTSRIGAPSTSARKTVGWRNS